MSGSKHLLAVNFRDPGHPEAGGAELHLEEILTHAVRQGHHVTWLASGFPGGAPEAEHRGVRIVRRGTWWNFSLVVPGVMRHEFSGPAPDLVIEDINKVPCFTPWWTRSPVAVVVPHLFGAAAFQEAAWPIATAVVLSEALIPLAYRRCRFVVISESTRDDLQRRGIARERITVVHCGLDHASYRPDAAVAKTPTPSLAFVGRLRRYKGLDWVLRALPAVLRRVPDAQLVVIGDGPYLAELKLAAARSGVAHAIAFLGFLPLADKVRRMQEAWALIQPSPKEGWGLTVVEAGACGTAVVATDAPGLRDSVRRDETGLLIPFDDTERLAEALVRVLTDAALRDRLAHAGVAWAARFTWPRCAQDSLAALLGAPGAA